MYNIKDYEPEDGWELIFKSFGTAGGYNAAVKAPMFALYNKYESKLRVFCYVINAGSDFNSATISVTHGDETGKVSAILEHGKTPARALDDFTKNIEMEVPNDFSETGGYWLHADYPIAYDPCACKHTTVLKIQPIAIQTGEIILKIEGSATGPTKQITKAGGGTNTGNTFKGLLNKLEKTASDSTKKVLKGNKSFKTLQGFADLIDLQVKDIKKNDTEASGLKFPPFLKAIPEIGTYIEILEYFTAGGKSTPPTPIAFESNLAYDLSASGVITKKDNYGGNFIYTPGSNHLSLSEHGKPVYDNILGVFNLLKTPVIKRHTSGWMTYYKMDFEQIKYVINPASGLNQTPVDIKAALYFDAIAPANYIHQGTQTMQQLIEAYDSKISGMKVYRTPYLPLSCIDDYLVELRRIGGVDFLPPKVYLKLYVRLKREDGNATADDVVLVMTYETNIRDISGGLTSLNLNPFPDYEFNQDVSNLTLTQDETIYAWETITVGNNIVTNGHKLTLIAGGEIISNSTELSPNIELIQQYPILCDGFIPPQSRGQVSDFCNSSKYKPDLDKRKENHTIKEKPQKSIIFQSSPNPFTNSFNVEFELESESTTSLMVFDALGRMVEMVIANDNLATGQHQYQIDGSKLQSGVYYVKLQTDNGIQTIKIIKQ